MRFSQRIGIRPIKTVLQVDSMDEDLKTRLWNTILVTFINKLQSYSPGEEESQKGKAYLLMWEEFFKKPLDKIIMYSNGNVYVSGFEEMLRDWFFKAQWYEVYDLIEFIADISTAEFVNACNKSLGQEVSGYRIVNKRVVQITSEEEINEIGEAIESSNSWRSVNTHLRTALTLLSDRKNPEYRNSIKESISAVESLCIMITNDNSATLGKALAEIEKKFYIHGALKSSFSALYGYTSDSSGIRHALTEGDTFVRFEDAKFMLVACSAFVNYLKAKINI